MPEDCRRRPSPTQLLFGWFHGDTSDDWADETQAVQADMFEGIREATDRFHVHYKTNTITALFLQQREVSANVIW